MFNRGPVHIFSSIKATSYLVSSVEYIVAYPTRCLLPRSVQSWPVGRGRSARPHRNRCALTAWPGASVGGAECAQWPANVGAISSGSAYVQGILAPIPTCI